MALGYQIGGYPLYFGNNVDNYIEIFVGADEKIRKASFSTQEISFQTATPLSPIAPEVALQQATQTNSAAIINTNYDAPIELDLSVIKKGVFNTVQIEYRVDSEQNLAYPFYRFTGSVTDSADQTFSVELIAPAIIISTDN